MHILLTDVETEPLLLTLSLGFAIPVEIPENNQKIRIVLDTTRTLVIRLDNEAGDASQDPDRVCFDCTTAGQEEADFSVTRVASNRVETLRKNVLDAQDNVITQDEIQWTQQVDAELRS